MGTMIVYRHKHAIWIKAISLAVVFLFFFSDIVWAGSSQLFPARNNLAPESRLKPFAEHHGVSFKNITAMIYAARELQGLAFDVRLEPYEVERRINSLNRNPLFIEINAAIENRIFDGGIQTGGGRAKSYKYAVIHLRNTRNEEVVFEIRFLGDRSRFTDTELAKLGIRTERDKEYLDWPGLENVWFVNPRAVNATAIKDDSEAGDQLLGKTEANPTPILGLTVIDGTTLGSNGEITENTKILVGVRSEDTNITHPNVISTPTQRIPKYLMDEILALAEKTEIDRTTDLSFPERVSAAFSLRGPSYKSEDSHNPLVYAARSLLAGKLGLAELLEQKKVRFTVKPATYIIGSVLYPGSTGEASAQVRRHAASVFINGREYFKEFHRFVNVQVVVDSPTLVPRGTPSYHHLRWINMNEFVQMNQMRDLRHLEHLFAPGEIISYCVHGLCLLSAYVHVRKGPGAPSAAQPAEPRSSSGNLASVEAEADKIHEENLKPKYIPSIPDKTILCHIIADSILPDGQLKNGILNRLEIIMRGQQYGEKVVSLSVKDPDDSGEFMAKLEEIKAREEARYPGYKVQFDVACPKKEWVENIQRQGVQALAFTKEGGGDIVQLEGIILALRALQTGSIANLINVYKLLTGKDFITNMTDIDELARLMLFILPVRKVDTNKLGVTNIIIKEYILSAA